jgi:hypothetical protein
VIPGSILPSTRAVTGGGRMTAIGKKPGPGRGRSSHAPRTVRYATVARSGSGAGNRRVCRVPALWPWRWPRAIGRGQTAARRAETTFPDERAWSAGAARRHARPATYCAIVSRETEPVSRHVTNAWPETRISGSAQPILTAGQRGEAQEWRFGLRKCLFRRDADRDAHRTAESARHPGAVSSFRDGEAVACERSRGEHSPPSASPSGTEERQKP